MTTQHRIVVRTAVVGLGLAALLAVAWIGLTLVRREQAVTQLDRFATLLDQQTTKTGAYIRAQPNQIQERDPWGSPIAVEYSQGAVAEVVTVRSAGPDRALHTADDLTAERMSASFKGLGEGIKEHAAETSRNIAKGLVQGAVEGVKESFRKPNVERAP